MEKKSLLCLFLAYGLWTTLPFYLKILAFISPYEVVAHRFFWSCFVLIVFFLCFRKVHFLRQWKKLSLSSCSWLFLSGCLIGINWLIYIYSVQENLLLQSSLGYFLSPFLSVLIAFVILKEKIYFWQWVSILLSVFGVFYLIFYYGEFPWIALGVSFTFAFYSLIHRIINLDASISLLLETLFLLPFSLGYLFLLFSQDQLAFFSLSWFYNWAVVFLGVISSLPLILFSYSVKRLSFLLIGFVQFYLPSALFLIGIIFFEEKFDFHYKITFSLIWSSVVIFVIHQYQMASKKRRYSKT